ncbi:fungal-specific transcription factor domain-containing protein [Penicillium pulvis]|uniref:fungal-specific transcription factor domain-containing protein n=1 Tax=Penicillium pulvis TaxID=1562058 RepID=UPI0025478C83|nr:fungal-specific transcription factor domain-containing protein [Penicillium pulvis]KAJ5810400.1 fungal-specific transcription factor domain-containing protein [Penicillium pulvis]
MRSDSPLTPNGVEIEQFMSPQSFRQTNLTSQLVSTTTHPDAYLDLLMPFDDVSFITPERLNCTTHLNPDSSSEGIPKSIFSQSASIGMNNTHSRSVSQTRTAHETHMRFRCGGMVQPSLWRSQRSASPGHHDTPSSIAKINCETESDLQFIGISDSHLLEMDDYAHVPNLKSESPILQNMFDFIGQEQHRVLGTTESEIPNLCDVKAINTFIQLYFEFFHPRFPMLHTSSFHVFNTSWIIVLAVVAIGSRYSRIRQAQQYANLFGKFLRHAIASLGKDEIQHTLRVPFVQAIILSQIDMSYSGTKTLYLQSQFQRNMVATLCRGLGTGLSRGYVTHTIQDRHRDTEPYYKWLGRELAVRAVHCGWLFDCQLNLNCDVTAIMSLDGFDIPLPCHEDVWNMTESQWIEAFQNGNPQSIPESHHMYETLTLITQDSENVPPIGDFSRLLAMMAIYQQSRVIMDASFIMTDTIQTSRSQSILGVSIYTGWRDIAIETLGLLGQSSKSSVLSDVYHHLMIVLHIPLKSLCTVAGWASTEDAILASKKELSAWMADNPQAARKTVLHAAILFKSLRSKPLITYTDAHDLLAATLAIWVYALLHITRSDDTLTGPIIYLDRHMNEDQKKSWIFDSNEDSPLHISGVGCILKNFAATRVLFEAKGCLARQSHLWGTYNQIMTVFEVMASSGTAISLD